MLKDEATGECHSKRTPWANTSVAVHDSTGGGTRQKNNVSDA